MTPKQKRTEIKRILHLLEPGNRKMFNRMYHHENIDEDNFIKYYYLFTFLYLNITIILFFFNIKVLQIQN